MALQLFLDNRLSKFSLNVVQQIQEKHLYTALGLPDYLSILQRIINSNLRLCRLHRFREYPSSKVSITIAKEWVYKKTMDFVFAGGAVATKMGCNNGVFYIELTDVSVAGFFVFIKVDISFVKDEKNLNIIKEKIEVILQQHSFIKAIYEFCYQRELNTSSIPAINQFNQKLKVDELFRSNWSEDFLGKFIRPRDDLFRSIKRDKTALDIVAAAMNPLFLAMWQQWNLRNEKHIAKYSVEFFVETITLLKHYFWRESKKNIEGDTFLYLVQEFNLSEPISDTNTLLLLSCVFSLQLEKQDRENHQFLPEIILSDNFRIGASNADKDKQNEKKQYQAHLNKHLREVCGVDGSQSDAFVEYTYAIAACIWVSNIIESGKPPDLLRWLSNSKSQSNVFTTDSTAVFKQRVIYLIHLACDSYLRSLDAADSEDKSADINHSDEWLISSALKTNGRVTVNRHTHYLILLRNVTAKCLENSSSNEQRTNIEDALFFYLCRVAEDLFRYRLCEVSDQPFECKPTQLSHALLYLANFYLRSVYQVYLPSVLMRTLDNPEFLAEHQPHILSYIKVPYGALEILLNGFFLIGKFEKSSTDFSAQFNHFSAAYAIAALALRVGEQSLPHNDLVISVTEESLVEYIDIFRRHKLLKSSEFDAFITMPTSGYNQVVLRSVLVLCNVLNNLVSSEGNELNADHIKTAARAVLATEFDFLSETDESNEPENVPERCISQFLVLTKLILEEEISFNFHSAKKLLDSELSRVFHYNSVLKSQMSVSVLSNRIIQIKGHSQRRSLQFILKLIQKISRISFKEWGWEPILLLEVDDKSLLLDELDELSRSLFHEVCSGISQWVQEQREFDFEVESLMQQENYSADIKDTIRRCIYIKSGTRILGNFEILDFLQLRQVKDFIRFKSKFV